MVSYLPELFILFFLIIFSVLISGSEVAFFSINPKVIKQFPKKGEKIKFKKIQFIIEELSNRRIKRVKVKLL